MDENGFKNVGGQRLWALIGIGLVAAANFAIGVASVQLMRLSTGLHEAEQTGDTGVIIAALPDLQFWGEQLSTITTLSLVAVILYAIFFMIWVYRASWNAGLFEPSATRITPGWSVGWFFIPVMNLFKPYRITREIYNSSLDPARPLEQKAPSLVGWWWGLWLSSIGFAVMSRVTLGGAPTLQDLSTASMLIVIGAMATIGALACLWKIVTDITRFQEAKRHRLSDAHGGAL